MPYSILTFYRFSVEQHWLHRWVLRAHCGCEIGIFAYYKCNSLVIPLLCCQHMQVDQMYSSAFWMLCSISYQRQVRSPRIAAATAQQMRSLPKTLLTTHIYSCLCPKVFQITIVISPPLATCAQFSFIALHSGCTQGTENRQNSPLGVFIMWGHGGNSGAVAAKTPVTRAHKSLCL